MFSPAILLLVFPMLAADEIALRKAVTLYASFDESIHADYAGGDAQIGTRFTLDKERTKFRFEKGFDKKVFTIAAGQGIAGGALKPVDVLQDMGRIFFPAQGNIAFKKGGWGGAVSVWINTDPNQLKTSFCDPFQLTEKGANNGGIWIDFNDAKPRRDMRMGVFPAVPAGAKGMAEDDPNAPIVKVPAVNFKVGDWHHLVLTWKNFDTGQPDAVASLYVDGLHQGDVKDRALAMDWDLEKAGIYVAINYLGLLDELAVFGRPLTGAEVAELHRQPGLLSALKQK